MKTFGVITEKISENYILKHLNTILKPVKAKKKFGVSAEVITPVLTEQNISKLKSI
jgi:hypothetical protein